jgi:site-specific DNA-methyltransferase (adenine-specific)
MNNIQLFLGDNREVLKTLEDNSVDLILTDPPYGINLTPQRERGKFKNTVVNNDNNLKWLPEFVIQTHRIIKEAGFIFCNWQNYDIFKQEFEKLFIIKNCIVWDKDWFGMGNNFRPNHEFILVICKTNFKTKSHNLSNILKVRRLSSQKMVHSCEKPIELLSILIKESTNENDIVLDPFAGSGGTGVACKLLNRKFIGIEIEENYMKIASERIKNTKMEG